MDPDIQRTDADVVSDAVRALRRHDEIPDQVQAAIADGVLVLTGTVEWYLQRERAEDVVQRVPGVRRVVNRIDVAPHPCCPIEAD